MATVIITSTSLNVVSTLNLFLGTRVNIDTEALGIAWEKNKQYRIELTEGFVKETGKNISPNLGINNLTTITTNALGPLKTISSPGDNEALVINNRSVTVTYDRQIQVGTGNIELYQSDDGDVINGGTDILIATIAVPSANITFPSATQMQINVLGLLRPNLTYYYLFDAGVVKDKDGFDSEVITNPNALNYTTNPTDDPFNPFPDLSANITGAFSPTMLVGKLKGIVANNILSFFTFGSTARKTARPVVPLTVQATIATLPRANFKLKATTINCTTTLTGSIRRIRRASSVFTAQVNVPNFAVTRYGTEGNRRGDGIIHQGQISITSSFVSFIKTPEQGEIIMSITSSIAVNPFKIIQSGVIIMPIVANIFAKQTMVKGVASLTVNSSVNLGGELIEAQILGYFKTNLSEIEPNFAFVPYANIPVSSDAETDRANRGIVTSAIRAFPSYKFTLQQFTRFAVNNDEGILGWPAGENFTINNFIQPQNCDLLVGPSLTVNRIGDVIKDITKLHDETLETTAAITTDPIWLTFNRVAGAPSRTIVEFYNNYKLTGPRPEGYTEPFSYPNQEGRNGVATIRQEWIQTALSEPNTYEYVLNNLQIIFGDNYFKPGQWLVVPIVKTIPAPGEIPQFVNFLLRPRFEVGIQKTSYIILVVTKVNIL